MAEVVVSSGKTITVTEQIGSRSFSTIGSGSEERRFHLSGSDSQEDISEALGLVAPGSTESGLIFNGGRFTPEYVEGTDSLWSASAEYIPFGGLGTGTRSVPIGTARLSFNATTESELVVLQKEVLSRNVPEGETAIPYEGIGDNGETFDGINLPQPRFSFKYDFHIKGEVLTTAYVTKVRDAVGKTNSAIFKGFEVGEVLCDGITGSYATNEDSMLSFSFKVRDNVPAVVQGRMFVDEVPLVDVPAHQGWNILDVHTTTVVNTSPKLISVVVNQIDVLRMFDTFDFNDLEIPGPDIVQ